MRIRLLCIESEGVRKDAGEGTNARDGQECASALNKARASAKNEKHANRENE